MTPKQHGALIAITGLLASAAEALNKPDVATAKMRIQADRVLKRCGSAIEEPAAALDQHHGGRFADSTTRHIRRAADTFTRIAAARMEKRQLYSAVFVGARVMACHYALSTMLYRHKLGREWRMLEQVTATMLGMILLDLAEYEALMFRIAEAFEMEATA